MKPFRDERLFLLLLLFEFIKTSLKIIRLRYTQN